MADDSILKVPTEEDISTPDHEEPEKYLKIENCLEEFKNPDAKVKARAAINAASRDLINELNTAIDNISDKIAPLEVRVPELSDSIDELNSSIEKLNAIKPATLDGVNNFKNTPTVNNSELATKEYVISKVLAKEPDIKKINNDITSLKDTKANKSLVYSKDSIDSILKELRDSIEPTVWANLNRKLANYATTRHVRDSISAHTAKLDPHHTLTEVHNILKNYVRNDLVLSKNDTLTTDQILSKIKVELAANTGKAVDTAMEAYKESNNTRFSKIEESSIKNDGTTPFNAPQSGISAKKDNELTTLYLVNSLISELTQPITDRVAQCEWRTSGNIQTTVGFMEDNTSVPETMTVQEVLDAIFYGKGISIKAPETIRINTKVPLTICVLGSNTNIDYIEIYLEGYDEPIHTLTKDDFVDGECIIRESKPITQDTKFVAIAYFTNNTHHEESIVVKCSLPMFVGLLPAEKKGNTITMDYLKELELKDIQGTLNRFIAEGPEVKSFVFKYIFEDPKFRQPFIALPSFYPDLESMITMSQSFSEEAFDKIIQPLLVDGTDITYKFYIYKEYLSSLNLDVTFNFKTE